MPNKYFAAIDLGTNSCRLVIADEKRNYVYKDTRPVRLGEGMAADMRFTPEAMQRGFEALADFQKHICAYNCCKVRAVATGCLPDGRQRHGFCAPRGRAMRSAAGSD